MSGIVGFLRARLDEDEAVARAATEGEVNWSHWTFDPRRSVVVTPDEFIVAAGVDKDAMNDPDGEHIARHDPARVLADVAAKRAMIDHVEGCEEQIQGEWGVGPTTEDTWVEVFGPMAAVYSDHPDYQQEWKP